MSNLSRTWRKLRVWTRRYPGAMIQVKNAGKYDGTWVRPHFDPDTQECHNMWIGVYTARVLRHYALIPSSADVSLVRINDDNPN